MAGIEYESNQMFLPASELFKSAVYNAFVKIVNKMTDKEILNNSEGIKLIQELGLSDEETIMDVKLKKSIYNLCIKFKDLFDEINIDYPKVLVLIGDEELKLRQDIEDKKDTNNPYPHLIGCARQIFGYRDKLDLANKFWEVQPFFYDESKLWWLWDVNNKMWNLIDEVDLFNSLDKALESDMSLKSRHRSEIMEALKRVGRGRMPSPIKKTMIQFRGKIYDLDNDNIFDATPDLFATNPIPHDIGKKEDTPVIDQIFENWVGKEFVQTLYEILAYSMIPDYPLHRIFCLVGSGMNGKGKFLELISRFIGEKNKTSTELDNLMTNRFEAAKLYKKLVCLMGETNFTELSKTSLLKRLSGGDTIGYEFKNKNPFDDYNYAKIIIATNSLPMTTDKTRGFYRRWLLIDFPNEFSEKKDILAEIPDEEYQNLAKKSIGILKRLLSKREFINEGSIEERMKRYEERANPVSQFIRERCVIDPNVKEPLFQFYNELKVYLTQRGHRVISKIELGRLLRNDGYDCEKENVLVDDESSKSQKYTKWLYIYGLKLKRKLDDFQETNENRPNRPDSTNISISKPYKELSEIQGLRGLRGPQNSQKKLQVSIIHHKCSSCGNGPSHTYDSYGKPICNDCARQLLANGIQVEMEEIEDN